MRRTMTKLRTLGGAVLLALLAGWLGGDASAQEGRKKTILVPLNGTERVQMTTKKALTRVEVIKEAPKDNIRISDVRGDPATVAITGVTRGSTTLRLTDVDMKVEELEIVVSLDVEYIRTQLRRAVPTANVTPIAVSDNTIILGGVVSRAEEVGVLIRVAQTFGVQIIDNMRVGGVQQVQLDVVIAQVSRSEFRALVFDFLGNSRNQFFGSTVGNAVLNPTPIGIGGSSPPNFATIPTFNIIPGSPNGQPTNAFYGILNANHGFMAFLQALRLENVSKTLAQPSLSTLSGTPGSFLVGGEQAVPVPAGLGQVGVQFEEFGTRLNYLPIVLGNGRIRLEIEPEVSSLSVANGTIIQGTVVPGRVTNRTHVTVEMETGQSLVIGGLIQHTVTGATDKVPILGDLPFCGALFRSVNYSEDEDEVVVLVTPHLIDAQDCAQVVKCFPGQDSRSPDDFELFLEGILEAPRGPRQVFQNNHYVPAYKNSPTAETFPCAPGCFAKCGTGYNGQAGVGNGTLCGPNGCAPVTVKSVPGPANGGEMKTIINPPPAPMPLPATLPPASNEPQ
jgi:pilus assembly protein CpaC